MTTPLNGDDIDCIRLGWDELGDITRYANWNSLLPSIKEHHPELIKAWEDYKWAELIMKLVVDNLEAK